MLRGIFYMLANLLHASRYNDSHIGYIEYGSDSSYYVNKKKAHNSKHRRKSIDHSKAFGLILLFSHRAHILVSKHFCCRPHVIEYLFQLSFFSLAFLKVVSCFKYLTVALNERQRIYTACTDSQKQ